MQMFHKQSSLPPHIKNTDGKFCDPEFPKQSIIHQGADKSLVRPGRKQVQKHVRDVHDFNNIETRAVIRSFFLQGKVPKEIHAILTETLACLLPGRAKNLSSSLYDERHGAKNGFAQHTHIYEYNLSPENILIPDTSNIICNELQDENKNE